MNCKKEGSRSITRPVGSQEGYFKYNVDFEDVYVTVLNKWLNVDDNKILGKQFEYMNFI
jgi:hypothetical protein